MFRLDASALIWRHPEFTFDYESSFIESLNLHLYILVQALDISWWLVIPLQSTAGFKKRVFWPGRNVPSSKNTFFESTCGHSRRNSSYNKLTDKSRLNRSGIQKTCFWQHVLFSRTKTHFYLLIFSVNHIWIPLIHFHTSICLQGWVTHSKSEQRNFVFRALTVEPLIHKLIKWSSK